MKFSLLYNRLKDSTIQMQIRAEKYRALVQRMERGHAVQYDSVAPSEHSGRDKALEYIEMKDRLSREFWELSAQIREDEKAMKEYLAQIIPCGRDRAYAVALFAELMEPKDLAQSVHVSPAQIRLKRRKFLEMIEQAEAEKAG